MVTDEMVKAAQRESGDLLHPDVMREALEAALSQVSAVPREPTDEMVAAGIDVMKRFGAAKPGPPQMWRAMYDAAPTTAGQRDRLVAALIVLARYGVPADIQEMLVMGSTNLAVAPGAFEEAVHAYTNERG